MPVELFHILCDLLGAKKCRGRGKLDKVRSLRALEGLLEAFTLAESASQFTSQYLTILTGAEKQSSSGNCPSLVSANGNFGYFRSIL